MNLFPKTLVFSCFSISLVVECIQTLHSKPNNVDSNLVQAKISYYGFLNIRVCKGYMEEING